MVEKEKNEFRDMIRLVDADVKGDRNVLMALQKIKGVGFNLANTICTVLKLDKKQKIGYLSEATVEKIEEAIRKLSALNIPSWMLNRQKDFETGNHAHLVSADLKLTKDFDIKRLKKIKSYRGMRHAAGLPVRGQRTKSHFRKGKAVGVQRKGKKGKK